MNALTRYLAGGALAAILVSLPMTSIAGPRRKVAAPEITMAGDQTALRAPGDTPRRWLKVNALKLEPTTTFGIRNNGQRVTHTARRDANGALASDIDVSAGVVMAAGDNTQARWTLPGLVTRTSVSGPRIFVTTTTEDGAQTMYKLGEKTTKRPLSGASPTRAAAVKMLAARRLSPP